MGEILIEMGLTLKKEVSSGRIPVFQKEFEVAQSGYNLDISDLPVDEIVPVGTPISCSDVTRKATVLKSAVLLENEADNETEYKVLKGHFLKVGEDVGAVIGGAAYAITAIDTSNSGYDVVTLGTTLGVALNAGDVLVKSSANGANACALHVVPTGLILDDAKIQENVSCASVLRGTVYARRIANGVHSAVKTALNLIVFSDSY